MARRKGGRRRSAFTLIEVLAALAVATVALTATLWLGQRLLVAQEEERFFAAFQARWAELRTKTVAQPDVIAGIMQITPTAVQYVVPGEPVDRLPIPSSVTPHLEYYPETKIPMQYLFRPTYQNDTVTTFTFTRRNGEPAIFTLQMAWGMMRRAQ